MIGKDIRYFRWENNLTQQDLANLSKVDRVTIAKAEAGNYVSEKTKFKIEQAIMKFLSNKQGDKNV